ncbi:hypothetical protein [Bradyrhizobium diazoefficiens]|uniref:hypothetical protein n=1 Tax=Bradyrhizobium diazoefficiens TaxID=1355477 RepID=UPI001AED3104|nr:hypothetical protein [Bradyrhizobium diazoefficiens]
MDEGDTSASQELTWAQALRENNLGAFEKAIGKGLNEIVSTRISLGTRRYFVR